jgi:hypothetical protein
LTSIAQLGKGIEMKEHTPFRVLFLDIDGVLNDQEWAIALHKEGRDGYREFNPRSVANLKRICEATGCKIVISSTWRLFGPIEAQIVPELARAGFTNPPIIGKTPDLSRRSSSNFDEQGRGDEVAAWLEEHPHVDRFICVDDDSDFRPEQPLIKTSHRYGLTDAVADLCIEVLLGNQEVPPWQPGRPTLDESYPGEPALDDLMAD